MTQHSLKIEPEFVDAVRNGIKTYEIRKNDRDYKVGDTIRFVIEREGLIPQHTDPTNYAITHILTSEEFPDGIKEGYAILSLRKIEEFPEGMKGYAILTIKDVNDGRIGRTDNAVRGKGQ